MDTVANQANEMKPGPKQAVIEWIDYILERKNWTATDLARKSDLAPSTLLRLLNDPKHQFVPSLKTLQKLAEGSGYPIPRKVTELMGATRMEPVSKKAPVIPIRPELVTSAITTVTVELRYVSSLPTPLQAAGSSGPATQIPAPPQIQDDDTAFAFNMPDDSFDPLIKAGSLMFASKKRDPVSGDLILLTDKNGKSRVRLLIGIDEGGLRLSKTIPVSETDTDIMSFDDIKDIAIVTIITKT